MQKLPAKTHSPLRQFFLALSINVRKAKKETRGEWFSPAFFAIAWIKDLSRVGRN